MSGSRLYVGAVITAGFGLTVAAAPRDIAHPVVAATLLAATVLLSTFKIRLPLGYGNATMTMAYCVDFVALLIEGANLAMLLGAIGVLIQCTVRVRRQQPIHRAAFSAAAVIIAVQLAGWGWRALGGSLTALTLTSTVLPLLVCAITYYLANTSLVVGAIAVTSPSPRLAWNPEFLWSAPGYLVAAVVAALVGLAMMHGVVLLLPIVASPLYACYRGYQARWREMGAALVAQAAQARTPAAV